MYDICLFSLTPVVCISLDIDLLMLFMWSISNFSQNKSTITILNYFILQLNFAFDVFFVYSWTIFIYIEYFSIYVSSILITRILIQHLIVKFYSFVCVLMYFLTDLFFYTCFEYHYFLIVQIY